MEKWQKNEVLEVLEERAKEQRDFMMLPYQWDTPISRQKM